MNQTISVQPKILTQDGKITIEIPKIEIPKMVLEGLLGHKIGAAPQAKKRTNWSEIKKLRGAWKNMKIDPMEYQKKIRAEWDRELD